MRPTPISREIIDRAIDEYGIIDYANATIREVNHRLCQRHHP